MVQKKEEMGEKMAGKQQLLTHLFLTYCFREEYMKPRLGSELSFVCTLWWSWLWSLDHYCSATDMCKLCCTILFGNNRSAYFLLGKLSLMNGLCCILAWLYNTNVQHSADSYSL
jgi:hypothetical protein